MHIGCKYCNFVSDAENFMDPHVRRQHSDFVYQAQMLSRVTATYADVFRFEETFTVPVQTNPLMVPDHITSPEVYAKLV